MSAITVKRYEPPEVDRREILRYAGVRTDVPELLPVLEECLGLMWDGLSYKAAFREISLSELPLEESVDLSKRLSGCTSAVIFGATVGLEPDRRMLRYGSRESLRALLCQAIGAERIEALCDLLCEDLAKEYGARGKQLRPRFSPGYGDCPLTLQRQIVTWLDAPHLLGLTLNESLLLSPTKSVTAIIGIE